jgi:predicted nucleic acid-binding protein
MKVLVDTSVWSAVLRRSEDHNQDTKRLLAELIAGNLVQMMGPIRQEILSGVREESQFDTLKNHLSSFPDVPIATVDYITAALYFNQCRRKGIQGSNTDYLICAVAVRNRMQILTTDNDFKEFRKIIPIKLYE